LKILLFHPATLPPRDYGGVERVVLWLAVALRDLGHSVTIAALRGSVLPRGVDLLSLDSSERSAVDLLRRIPRGIDVVHFQAPPEKGYFQDGAPPSITTIHGNGKSGETFSDSTFFLSRNHAERHGSTQFVYNGVDPEEFSTAHALGIARRKSAPLFLSKTSLRTKNLAGAIRIADAAEMNLTIAGGRRPLGLRLRALLSGHTWVGPVAGEKKRALLAQASALLFPIVWDEPFGLVMVEAMLSGTPVVGARRGSVPEVVGELGGIVLDAPEDKGAAPALEEWAAALHRAESLDPEAIRASAIARFSHRRMAESYLEVYKQAIRGEFK